MVFVRGSRLCVAALAIMAILGSVVVVAEPGVAGAQGSGTLYVSSTGSDTGSCQPSTQPCATIAYAVTQANPGSTIDVGPGSYPQQLFIDENLSIIATGGAVTVDPSVLPFADSDTDSSFSQYAIVDITSGASVMLKGLTIDGTNAKSQFTGCGPDFVGVYYHDSSGIMKKDKVQNIELPPDDFGCQDGLGVYVASDAGAHSTVIMSGDTVTAYDKNGITCDDIGTSCTIGSSTVTGIGATPLIAQNGIQAVDANGVTLSGNTVSANSWTGGGQGNQATGLLMFDVGTLDVSANTLADSDINAYLGSDGTGPTPGSWTLTGNTVTGATDNVPGGETYYGDGIQVDSTTSPVSVTDNIVTGSAENGIITLGASNVTVEKNTANHNADNGIDLGAPASDSASTTPSTDDTVSTNTAKKNGNDGILTEAGTTANNIKRNVVKSNVHFDLEDLGSGNRWTSNTCKPAGDASPSGLCS